MTKKRTEIAELGAFGLVERLIRPFETKCPTTLCGPGDDAAVLAAGDDEAIVCTTDLLVEGIDFDLTYFPMTHLGYKAVVVGVSDILAMNARPEQVALSLGISSKIPIEALDDLYAGVKIACDELGVDLMGGDTKPSLSGLIIGVTAAGRAERSAIVRRNGAKANELICLTGNVGAAYMGLRLLEREKRVLADVEHPEPKFEGYDYLLKRYLRPRARVDIVQMLAEERIVPTSMIDLSDGLASDLMQLCKASGCGARIYLERIPLDRQMTAFADEIHADPVVAALNGGEDYELLFTAPLAMQEELAALNEIYIIGHMTDAAKGVALVTPDGSNIELRAQGFVRQKP